MKKCYNAATTRLRMYYPSSSNRVEKKVTSKKPLDDALIVSYNSKRESEASTTLMHFPS